jgi:hypothetical protein
MSCVPCGSWVRRMLCGVRTGPAEAAAAGRVEPASLGHPAPTGVGSPGAAPPPFPQWQSSGVRAGGSPAQLKTVLETTLQH